MAFAVPQQPYSISADQQLQCSACQVSVLPNERNSHYRSDWHRYNVKRKCVGMPPIGRAVFEKKLASIVSAGKEVDTISNKRKKKEKNQAIQRNYDTLLNNDQWRQFGGARSAASDNIPSSLVTYRCTLCSKTFKTHQQCTSHLNTRKHRDKFMAYHKNLRDKQQEEISAYRATDGADAADVVEEVLIESLPPLSSLEPLKSIKNNEFIITKQVVLKPKKGHLLDRAENAQSTAASSGESGAISGDPEGEEEEEEDTNEAVRKSIDLLSCLFCAQSFADQASALQHMEHEHGFFVPLPKRLTDQDALLTTAGEVVGKWHQCVWCWRNFGSVRSVQSHMRDLAHCKLQIEFGPYFVYEEKEDCGPRPVPNEDELSLFHHLFDFDKTVVDTDEDGTDGEDYDMMEGGRELMLSSKPCVVDVNEARELVRDDGTVIGHRSNAVLYKQKHKYLATYNETQTEEQLIAQVNYPERKFKLQEIERQKRHDAYQNSGAIEDELGGKVKAEEMMHLQTRAHKVSFQNWVNLQKSKQLY